MTLYMCQPKGSQNDSLEDSVRCCSPCTSAN